MSRLRYEYHEKNNHNEYKKKQKLFFRRAEENARPLI